MAGNRLQQSITTGAVTKTTKWLVDPNTSYAQVVQERDEANVLQARYIWEDSLAPLVMLRKQQDSSFKAFYYLNDGQDSVRQLTDNNGVVTDSYHYDAWGTALAGGSGNTKNPFRYTGQQLDADGKYFLRARYYTPGTGRFLGQDPVLGKNNDPITLHRYQYANLIPSYFVDPSGRMSATVQQGLLMTAMMGSMVGWIATQQQTFNNLIIHTPWPQISLPSYRGMPAERVLPGFTGTPGSSSSGPSTTESPGGVHLPSFHGSPANPGTGPNFLASRPLTNSGYPAPFGFEDGQSFEEFSRVLRQGLPSGIEPIFQGSSVTGKSHETGKAFDDGRISDFDIALAGQELFDAAKALPGVRIKDGVKIGPIDDGDMNFIAQALGLEGLRQSLSALAGGRPVNFMLFNDVRNVRGDRMYVPIEDDL